MDVVDETIQVPDTAAFEMSSRLAREEGILAGISAGANVWAACELAKRPEMDGKTSAGMTDNRKTERCHRKHSSAYKKSPSFYN